MDLAALLAAMISVESGGKDMAVGDGGRARGALQIHRRVVEDVNRITGSHYLHSDAHNRSKAVRIAEVYITHYCTPERFGHSPTAEEIVRTWNGGPSGWRKPATMRYWLKVKQEMRRDP